MTKPNLSLSEIKDLVGKPGVKLKVWGPFGLPMGEGELIGVLDQPSVILRDTDGDQHHFAASQMYELVEPPLPEEPDVLAVELAGRVWTRAGWPGQYHWETPGFHGRSWLALNQLAQDVPIVPLVPDSAANAVLPFALGSCERSAMVNVLDGGRVSLAIETEWYTPEEAERIAAAILRAAREAKGKADV